MDKDTFEEMLNEMEIPEHDKQSNGGRICDEDSYGSWLRENDPIAFEVAYNDENR